MDDVLVVFKVLHKRSLCNASYAKLVKLIESLEGGFSCQNGKLHQGRPTMLSCRMMTKRVQFFPKGTIQLLSGGVTSFHLHHLFQKNYFYMSCLFSFNIDKLFPILVMC